MLGGIVFGAAGIACVIGLGLGLLGLFAPSIAARIVRLQPDPAFPDGAAEFRASFGGLFIGVHGLTLALLTFDVMAGAIPFASVIACAVAASLWLGTAFGRLAAIAVSPVARTGYQAAAVIFETVLGLALCAPLAAWLLFDV